jgi:hypothetical protein
MSIQPGRGSCEQTPENPDQVPQTVELNTVDTVFALPRDTGTVKDGRVKVPKIAQGKVIDALPSIIGRHRGKESVWTGN